MTPLATTSIGRQRARSAAPRRASTHRASVDVARYLIALLAETNAYARLQKGVDLLPTLVHGCHHASITTVTGGRLHVRVATDGTGRRADELQDELDEGPSLQAARTGHSVVAHDLRSETRWVDWCSAAATGLELRSVLSVLLVATRRPLATLNLYSDTDKGFSGIEIALLHTLAGPLTDTLVDRQVGAHELGPAA